MDHDILIQRLKTSYGLSGMVLQWFQTYLVGRSQCVRTGLSASLLTLIVCGVPQGSVLGPILFLMYTADLLLLIRGHGLCPHLYADDTQSYGFCRPSASLELQNSITNCVDDVARWMRSNRLQLSTCGLLPVDVLTSCRSYHFELALTKLRQLLSFVTSVYTSNPTSR